MARATGPGQWDGEHGAVTGLRVPPACRPGPGGPIMVFTGEVIWNMVRNDET